MEMVFFKVNKYCFPMLYNLLCTALRAVYSSVPLSSGVSSQGNLGNTTLGNWNCGQVAALAVL